MVIRMMMKMMAVLVLLMKMFFGDGGDDDANDLPLCSLCDDRGTRWMQVSASTTREDVTSHSQRDISSVNFTR